LAHNADDGSFLFGRSLTIIHPLRARKENSSKYTIGIPEYVDSSLIYLFSFFVNSHTRVISGQKLMGEIPQVNQTFNVVGNANEYGLVIGESTFGGAPTRPTNNLRLFTVP
jgi:hypothetical protein